MIPQTILERILQSHKLDTSLQEDWIIVEDGKYAICALTQNKIDQDNSVVTQLNIGVFLGQDKILWDTYAGIGKDETTAIQEAFKNFSLNSFHVLLSVFWEINDNDMVGIEKWEIGDEIWEATIGDFECRGDFDIPHELYTNIEEAIKNTDLQEDINWFSLYYANINIKDTIVECLYNNQKWEIGNENLKNVDWEKSKDYYSLRNFIIIRKIG